MEIARSYHALAELYFKMGKLKEAKEYNSLALAMREKCVGGSPDVANSLNHLAKLNNSLGNYAQALEMQEKSLSLLQGSLGSNHLQVAQCYHNLGDLHYRQGRFDHSESCYQKSLEIRKVILGDSIISGHPDIASSLGALAFLYTTLGKYKISKDYFQRALTMLESIFPPEHPDVAKMKNNIGYVLMKMGEFSEAEKSIFSSVEILKKTLGTEHPELANTLDDLAEVYLGQSKYKEAEDQVKHALEIRKSVFGDNHAEIANCKACMSC